MKRALLIALVFAFSSACGGKTPGEAVRPKEQTFAGAMNESSSGPCRETDMGGEPLVVDWKPEQRGDLEVLMREGVAVVSYTCKQFKLLKDCKVDGKYGYLGMTKKEQVVRLTNADEVKANLPLQGVGLAANISAEMQRGATLDVALVMVGKVKTTWGKVAADELKGECDGATHFVKGATVGAFVMETGTKGEAKTAAQLFGAGASGGSSSAKNVRNQDGDLSDCAKAAPDSPKAPAQCQAIVRLELKPIAKKGAGAPVSAEPPPVDVAAPEMTCPKGLVLADGKCTATAAAFLCHPNDGKECLDQCGKGNAPSCGAAGALLAAGGGGLGKDETKAREILGKGCDASDTKSCTNLGLLLAKGRGGPKDASGAFKRFDKACADGDPLACGMMGQAYESGEGATKDEGRAIAFLQRGCEGGQDTSCGTIGRMLVEGRGAAKDVTKGADYLKRACDGGHAKSCVAVAEMFEAGQGLPKQALTARILFQRACMRMESKGCAGQGRLEFDQGGSQDNAKRAFEMGCTHQDDFSCAAQKVLFGSTRPFVLKGADAMALQKSCSGGATRDCTIAGTLQIASGNKALGMPMIERACTAQDAFACAVKKK
jgi:uncharacterized protein